MRHSVVFLVGLIGLVQGFFGGGSLMAKRSCTNEWFAGRLSFDEITVDGFSADRIAVDGILGDSIAPKMQWFADAKLGIFIHWGIYAVEGTSESWSFHSRQTTYPY